jgi:hypothetical protein
MKAGTIVSGGAEFAFCLKYLPSEDHMGGQGREEGARLCERCAAWEPYTSQFRAERLQHMNNWWQSLNSRLYGQSSIPAVDEQTSEPEEHEMPNRQPPDYDANDEDLLGDVQHVTVHDDTNGAFLPPYTDADEYR